jgi:4-amino-4-deoxy-L-arabinose transferase-like glycosyltransferase
LKRPTVILGCFAALVLFYGLGTGTLPLLDRDEPRFAEAAREMIERGDLIVPFFNDAPRLQKPPLIYWIQIVFYRLFDESERSARLPSVLAASLTTLAVFGLGSRLYDKRIGFWAALVFALCLQTIILAKAATADMLMVLFVTLASWAGWELYASPSASRRPYWWIVFYGSLGLGFLAKGPVAWLPLVMAVPQKRRGLVGGMLFALFLVGLWGIPALVKTTGEFWRVGIGENVIGRSLEVMEGHGTESWFFYVLTLPFYFLTVFFSFFPWSIFLPGATVYFADKDHRSDKEKYLLSGILIMFVIFSLVRTKLPHYTYPAFPLLSVLFARFWSEKKKNFEILKRIAVTSVLFCTIADYVIYPRLVPYFPSAELLKQSRHLLKPEMEFASVDYQEPSLVWNFRKVVKGFHHLLKKSEIGDFMRLNGPRFSILPTADFAQIDDTIDPRWETFRIQGFNVAKGKWVDLIMVVKQQ